MNERGLQESKESINNSGTSGAGVILEHASGTRISTREERPYSENIRYDLLGPEVVR